ncbi:PREDICTED: uncharacterized protein LOC101816284 isoform X3 [Ficedula albicollis]|uniref:uncharacterized protein LOC101816284 isoform X3 n=1 Tax=Ficedula albicollis TaxID=59894 RepID=UPI00035A0ECE|nr:PREDICTED: uncharacterized protein LOC101816284 isoform X3 [Ficedula albicollis]
MPNPLCYGTSNHCRSVFQLVHSGFPTCKGISPPSPGDGPHTLSEPNTGCHVPAAQRVPTSLHHESPVEQRPFGLCSLPLPALQSMPEMWRRHSCRGCAGERHFRRTLFPAASLLRLEVYCGHPAQEPRRPLPRRLARLAAQSPARRKTTKAKAAGLGRHARGAPRPNSRAARLPQCGWHRGCAGLRSGAQPPRPRRCSTEPARVSGEAPGSVSAGITAGSPRKMHSGRRCALSAAVRDTGASTALRVTERLIG